MSKIPSSKTSKPRTEYSLLKGGEYEARLVRFVGLGIQEQQAYQGQAKAPAFKCALTFELIDVDTKGVDADGNEVSRPACQFDSYFLFPNASRGKVFDLCSILEPGIKETPDNLEWFKQKLGAPVNLTIGSYVSKKTGKEVNCIQNIAPIPAKYQSGVGAARTDLVFFDPYEDTPEMFAAFSELYPFQRDMLLEAHDHAAMPYAGKEPAKRDAKGNGNGGEDKPSKPAAPAGNAVDEDDDAPF